MAANHGGELVKAGFFFNLDSWEISTITGREGGILDGEPTARFLRVPVLAMLLLAPLMGALFAMFLPFIGIFLMAQFLADKAWHGVRYVAHALVGSLGPAWQPSAAHLAGTPDEDVKKGPDPTRAAETSLDALEQEIVARSEQDSKR